MVKKGGYHECAILTDSITLHFGFMYMLCFVFIRKKRNILYAIPKCLNAGFTPDYYQT